MIVEIDCGGRRRVVELQPGRGGWSALIDGRPVLVSLDRVAARWSVLIAPGGASSDVLDPGGSDRPVSKSHEVALEALGSGRYVVRVDGRLVTASVLDPRRAARRPAEGREATGLERIVSPMPGRIVKVLVSPGDIVAARQGLVVVEAMKMENELRTSRGGRVAEVGVREGELIEAGTVLVVVGPR
jgi:biotin carboxyl carrier protein